MRWFHQFAGHRDRLKQPCRPRAHRAARRCLSLGCLVFIAGCSLGPIHKQAAVLSEAIAPVVDQSAQAYREAQAIHDQRSDYEAVVAYKAKDASYNPRNSPVLLSDKDIDARLATLAALQVYARSLLEITKGTDSAALDNASKSAGSDLAGAGNDLAPSVEKVLKLSSESSTTAPLTPEVRNGISTALDALGQFLVGRKIDKELPARIGQMDPHLQDLCRILRDDIETLDRIETRDYDRMLDLEKQFVLEDTKPESRLSDAEWRREVMQLPELARRQRDAHIRLAALREAIDRLANTHHALATAAAQSGNSPSWKDSLAALADAGKSLGDFYSSLPTP